MKRPGVLAWNTHRHRLRTDASYRQREQERWFRDFQARRQAGRLLTMTEITLLSQLGISIPYDLMPGEYWHPRHLPWPKSSEEVLGEDF